MAKVLSVARHFFSSIDVIPKGSVPTPSAPTPAAHPARTTTSSGAGSVYKTAKRVKRLLRAIVFTPARKDTHVRLVNA